MDDPFYEIVSDLRSYLESLKGMGIESLAVSKPMPKESASALFSAPRTGLTLKKIRADLGECRRCKLHRTRRTLVFGEGREKAKLMFIGEGPGYDEDVQGRPFVGKAGQLLTKIIQSIHLERDEVYITNVVKCRPPQNRNPEPDEIESCHPFLIQQIDAIQPRIICALGTVSAQSLLQTSARISALRGRVFDVDRVKVIPTYHPAFLLRNPEKKKDVWEDMKRILTLLGDSP